jgi:hypothetical protein
VQRYEKNGIFWLFSKKIVSLHKFQLFMKKILCFLLLFFSINCFCYAKEKSGQTPLFSTGVTVRKMLDDYVAVERGVIYSFLSSYYEETWAWWGQQPTTYSERSYLHYVGIPFNLIVYLGNPISDKWQFYLMSGLTLELELRAIHKEVERRNNSVHPTTIKTSFNGMHLSLNGGFGVSYHLDKKWNIHLEPRVGYSLPERYGNRRPSYFGVNLGLNYKIEAKCPPSKNQASTPLSHQIKN